MDRLVDVLRTCMTCSAWQVKNFRISTTNLLVLGIILIITIIIVIVIVLFLHSWSLTVVP